MKIADGNLLYESYLKAIKDSKWKKSTKNYKMDALSNLYELQQELINKTYKTGETSSFLISERGKTRMIHGNQLKDRIVRHALCDYELMPKVQPYLMLDNYASQENKGVEFARKRLKQHLRKYYQKYHTNEGYVLTIDFSKYYDNIRHDIAYEMLAKFLEDDEKLILQEIMDSMKVDVSYMTDEEYQRCMDVKFDSVKHQEISEELKTKQKFMYKSVSIGDQTSQIIGIYYPVRIDNLIHNVYGNGLSGRYMDDIYVISSNKDELKHILHDVEVICNELGIYINYKKTRIYKLDKGFNYLQRKIKMTSSGKVICKVRSKQINREKKKIRKLAKKSDISDAYLLDQSRSWLYAVKDDMTQKQVSEFNEFMKRVIERRKKDDSGLQQNKASDCTSKRKEV